MICKQTNPLLSADSTHRIDVGTIQVTKGTENNFYQIVHTQCVSHFIKEAIFSKFLQTLHQKLSTHPTLADQELMDHTYLKIHLWNKEPPMEVLDTILVLLVLEQGTNLGKGECVCVHVLRRTIYWGIISITHLSTLPCHIMLYHQWWSIVQTSKQSSHTSSKMILLFCHWTSKRNFTIARAVKCNNTSCVCSHSQAHRLSVESTMLMVGSQKSRM